MNLSPELLAEIQAALNAGTLTLGNPNGRSPVRRGRFQDPRQLDDLRLPATKDDPRPTFLWSAVAPRDGIDLTRTHEYPRLLWHGETGTEITVTSKDEQQTRLASGYTTTAPAWVEPDPMELIRAQWDALSPDDQALLLESQKQDRIALLKSKLSVLPENKLAELLSKQAHETPEQQEVRRGPGRPRKDIAS